MQLDTFRSCTIELLDATHSFEAYALMHDHFSHFNRKRLLVIIKGWSID